jgi:cytochrome b involved in lipid metabolism
MNILRAITVMVSVVVIGGCTLGQSTDGVPTKMEVKTYSLSDIEEHTKAENCWMAIEGKVYDVTKFIASQKHPGGEAILQGCGKDATELFNTRPMGSKTPHSDKARAGLENFYIGELQK